MNPIATSSAIDPRIAESGLSWANVGVFFVSYKILGLILLPILPLLYVSILSSSALGANNTAISTLIGSVSLVLIIFAAALIAVRNQPTIKTKIWSLGVRRCRWYWYIAAIAAVLICSTIFLLFAAHLSSLGNFVQAISNKVTSSNTASIIVVAANILAVIGLEVMSRGIVLPALLLNVGRLWGLPIAALFSLANIPPNIVLVASLYWSLAMLFLAQYLLSWIAARSGSILPSMLASSLIVAAFHLAVY